MEFYSLERAEPLADARELTLPRAVALLDAIVRQRDFTLVGLARIPAKEGLPRECLIVEVECDRVPKHNAYGLLYRERVAIVVGHDRREVPSVFALRKGFPRLAHQHQAPAGSPAHLCLYFEPASAVLRTWTAAQFLRRIQWWMEQNARGELHPADQPLDHLFFSSKYELVLPWNFDTLATPGAEFIVVRGDTRPDGGVTSFLRPKIATSGATALLVEFTLPPVVGAAIESDPVTLGQLADVLALRGSALLPHLQPQLQALVNAQGVSLRPDKPFTVILLHIPVCREEGAPPEKIGRRAFVLVADPLDVGLATGALMRHEGKTYSAVGLLDAEVPTTWRGLAVMPMEVLAENTPEAARIQSGLSESGPKGVIVGAGALGSAIANLWSRSGWGRWTIVDKDHVRPHNLSRHTAVAEQIGDPKALAVAATQYTATHGAGEMVPLVANASDPEREDVQDVLRQAAWVVDVSASLEYPRYASTLDGIAPHASLFITPSAKGSVALLEDADRTVRLRTLEAQYYRAIINMDWGHAHLAGNLGAFWSGASCRDISMVMPYARVMLHASVLADELPRLRSDGRASIRVWERDGHGGLTPHEVAAEREKRFQLGDLQVYIDDGLERILRDWRASALPAETGGILLGYYDFNVDSLVLVTALPAPPDSRGTPASFERGVEGLIEAVVEASRRTAGIVGYVGEWHSHPRGHSAAPSGDDLFQLTHLALGMGDDGLPGLQLIVGESDLRVLSGTLG